MWSKKEFCYIYTRDSINNWASLGFGGKHFTEKKKNYFSYKVQEKKVSKQYFQDGKKTCHQKNPKTTSQLLWLAPISTTKIFPQKVETNISSWKKYLLWKSEWCTFMWVKWITEQKVEIPETETRTFSRKTKLFRSFTFFLPTIETLSLGWKAIYHFAEDWQSKILILYIFPLALTL